MALPVQRDHVHFLLAFQHLPGANWHRAAILLGAVLWFAPPLPAYSVLTHEAIVDSAWDRTIQPLLLLRRFPNSTADDLRHAHAYAYAGCILQDHSL